MRKAAVVLRKSAQLEVRICECHTDGFFVFLRSFVVSDASPLCVVLQVAAVLGSQTGQASALSSLQGEFPPPSISLLHHGSLLSLSLSLTHHTLARTSSQGCYVLVSCLFLSFRQQCTNVEVSFFLVCRARPKQTDKGYSCNRNWIWCS